MAVRIARKLRLDHIARVDAGANQHAHAVMVKRSVPPGEPVALLRAQVEKALALPDPMSRVAALTHAVPLRKGAGADAYDAALGAIEAQEQIEAVQEAFWETMSALRQAAWKIMEDATIADKAAAIRDALARMVATLPAEIAEEQAEKRHDPPGGNPPGDAPGAGSPPALVVPGAGGDGIAKVGEMDPKAGQPGAGQTGAGDGVVTMKRDDLDALVAQAVTKALGPVQEQVTKLQGDLSASRDMVVAETTKRLDTEAAAEAEKRWPSMPGEPVAKGRHLRSLLDDAGKTDPKDAEVAKRAKDQLAFFDAAEAHAKALTRPVGRTTRADPAAEDADKAIMAKAEEIAKRDGIPIGEASRKVPVEAPELWQARYGQQNGRA